MRRIRRFTLDLHQMAKEKIAKGSIENLKTNSNEMELNQSKFEKSSAKFTEKNELRFAKNNV